MEPAARIDVSALVDLLGGWAEHGAPLYVALADALAAVIDAGELPAGSRLPAERVLAAALPTARGTVVAAYRRLAEHGLVVRRQGSGTTVRPDSAPAARRAELDAGMRAQSLTGRTLRRPVPAVVDLALSVLDDPESLPAEAFDVDPTTLARATVGASGRGHGYAPLGLPALRERIAELLTGRGLATGVDEVAVTLGAQHGIALAAAALVRPGDVVAVEDPTYPGAIDAYSRAGMRFAAVATDGGGTDPGALRRVLDQRCDLVHLSPVCSSPAGVATTPARRREIADLLAGSGAWLVEDAALEHLVDDPGRPLAASRPERTVLVGTTSKVFWGGLRVGWLRAPAAVVARVGRIRAAHDLGSSIGPQVTALRLLDDLDEIADARRGEATRRRAHLAAGLATVPGLRVERADGGLSLWVRVAEADRVVGAAGRLGLDVVAGSTCSPAGGGRDHLRISAWAPTAVLDEAVVRLGRAVEEVHRA